MAGWRQAFELALTEEDVRKLNAVARSRTEAASRVERARMLLAYREDASFYAVGRAVGVHHQTVQRAALNAQWPTAPLRRSTICRAPGESRRSRPRPRLG